MTTDHIATAPARFGGFDYLRVAGILAVVYIHGCDTSDVARKGMKWLGFAVPCFFLMSAFLTQTAILKKGKNYGVLLVNKLRRLAPPFTAWSTLYLCVRFLKSRATDQAFETSLFGAAFWGDASHQLYFVPLLFYFFVIWIPIMLIARSQPFIAIACCVLGVIAAFWYGDPIQSLLPEKRWFIGDNLIWFPLGIVSALLVDRYRKWVPMLRWPAMIGGAIVCYSGFTNVVAVSLIVFFLALSVTHQPSRWIELLATYAFGVYLVHVLLIEAMQFLAPKLGIDVSRLSITLLITLFAAIGSYLLCALLGRSSRTRWSVT